MFPSIVGNSEETTLETEEHYGKQLGRQVFVLFNDRHGGDGPRRVGSLQPSVHPPQLPSGRLHQQQGRKFYPRIYWLL
ncbi:hypothetical protein EVAR_34102_1 [Eumeta japonica]|uniref:Uncharacterized protein n=1 Tax=Eumeta variegata TaxID=151549 RepID=A0A4C1WIN0_EUMVA|nr:hypothetical protein EVAR_34102_1 [Eumeta japonica]